jgi:hypothetical protein
MALSEGNSTDENGNIDYPKMRDRIRSYEDRLNEGMEVTLVGTVKYLEIFKDQKQTTLTRCKLLKF